MNTVHSPCGRPVRRERRAVPNLIWPLRVPCLAKRKPPQPALQAPCTRTAPPSGYRRPITPSLLCTPHLRSDTYATQMNGMLLDLSQSVSQVQRQRQTLTQTLTLTLTLNPYPTPTSGSSTTAAPCPPPPLPRLRAHSSSNPNLTLFLSEILTLTLTLP